MIAQKLQLTDYVVVNAQRRTAPHEVLANTNQSVVQDLVSLGVKKQYRLSIEPGKMELIEIAIYNEAVLSGCKEPASGVFRG